MLDYNSILSKQVGVSSIFQIEMEMERCWDLGYVEPHPRACCILCETEIELDWLVIRPLMVAHEWVETSWTQKNAWLILMDDERNLTARARVYPRDGTVELRFERYHLWSPAIYGRSDFAIMANFDYFWGEISALI